MSAFYPLRAPAAEPQTDRDMGTPIQLPGVAGQSARDPSGLTLAPFSTWTRLTMPIDPPPQKATWTFRLPHRPGLSREAPRNLGTPGSLGCTIGAVTPVTAMPRALDPPTPHARRMLRLAEMIDATHAPLGASTRLVWSVAGLIVATTAAVAAFTSLTVASRGDHSLKLSSPGGAYSIELGRPTLSSTTGGQKLP